ncbi:translation initiation factor eIF2A [Nitzschia inconspicua]|uniref:Eukaryotic translation initiation factor 3 subunit B n=1 Tax=Nitzschia inconspicua TaxID=303405 RepID=A0A9K3K9L8_9STRA|nr:translation initiation factor eIF2A [Nitzschia inconspicua]KAG7366196.1 translation initiation factor eIF2A [Nitzschia inconspicua]
MTSIEDQLAAEAEELDGYFSDTPLEPQPNYPPLNEKFDNAIIILNLPQVPDSKLEKLTKVVMKLVSRIGNLAVNEDTGFSGVLMPFNNDKGTTEGFAFCEYETPEEAKNAIGVLDGYKFDKNHSLNVVPYPRAEKLQKMKETEFVEPERPPFVEKPNATAWLEDPSQRDQFVIRYGKETAVYWYDHKSDPVVDYAGEREKEAGVSWCEYYCHWSPKGSYLATLVPARGVILWSGSDYEKVGRFVAPDVKTVMFSPQENYLLTNNMRLDDETAIKVYHIQSGKLMRAFPLFPDNFPRGDNNNIPPPPFQWSHDDNYLARMGQDLISIYSTPTMRLLDKKSLLAEGIHEFHWSPKANVLACWSPEQSNSPAHVDLIEIPSRKKLRQKNLFNVTKCSMVWHDDGEFLAVKVTRHTKSKKTLYNNIELFRVNDPGVPVEMLDIKDAVMSLVWEPRGTRFAMIHAENPSSTKVDVSFYDMMKKVPESTISINKKGGNKKGPPQMTTVAELNKIETLEGKQCNVLFWSPAGSTILMASLGDSASGTLEFYDVNSKTLVIKEHYRANKVLWDPAGRTVATCVSQPVEGGHFKFAMDNGYILWSFQGKQLYQQSFETFYQLLWRPRENLLSKQEIKKVKKNLKNYEKQFEKADKERQRALYLEETKGKRAERKKYRDLLSQLRELRREQKRRHVELQDGYDSDDEEHYTTREMAIETILSTKEEVVL